MDLTRDERLEQLKISMEYLEVSQAAAAAAVGVSAKTIKNYLSGVTYDEKTIRKLEVFLRSREFYRGYAFRQKDDFSRLFDKLWNKCKEFLSTEMLCETLGLKLSEANHIREKRKALDVRAQYHILFCFHELCIDSTGLYRPGFKECKEDLYLLLGLDFPKRITQRFADLINELTDSLDFEVKDETLSRMSGISVEDIAMLRCDNDCPYDVWDKCDILDALRSLCNGCISEKAEEVSWKISRILMFCEEKKDFPENAQIEAEFIRRRDRIVSKFRKYNIEIQNIILSHGRAFFDLSFGSGFWDYLNSYPIPAELCLGEIEAVSEFDYYKSILELFRLLSRKNQQKIFTFAMEGFAFPFPDWYTDKGMPDFEILVQYLNLSLITKNKGRLINLNSKGTAAFSPIPDWWWEYYNSERVQYKLGLDSQEWCLWALLTAAVQDMRDLNPLIKEILSLL